MTVAPGPRGGLRARHASNALRVGLLAVPGAEAPQAMVSWPALPQGMMVSDRTHEMRPESGNRGEHAGPGCGAGEVGRLSVDPARTSDGTAGWKSSSTDSHFVRPVVEEPVSTTRMGRFVVLRRLGAGGMGVVFKAYDPELDRKVALKLLHRAASSSGSDSPEARRLLREAQAMAQLSHPNVITVYDVGTCGEQVFIAMELVDGVDLCQWLKQRTRTWREVMAVLVQAGEGLAAAHAAGLVHRDFKPANVLVGRDGRVRVLDFGLARAVSELRPPGEAEAAPTPAADRGSVLSSPLTCPGSVVGTPAYMAPEQISGSEVDARGDQYSFAVTLYEALYRRRPFDEPSDVIGLLLHGRGKILPPPAGSAVPARVWHVVERALAVDPEARYPSMNELVAALRRVSSSPRRLWASVAAIAVLAAGLGLLVGRDRGLPRACSGGQERWEAVWSPERRAAVGAAFAASGSPLATTAFDLVAHALDRYGQAWVEAHTEACVATHVRHEQSPELLDLRMACLDRRLKNASALIAVLERADSDMVVEAPKAVLALPSLDGCADAEALMAPVPLPPDAAARAAAAALGERLARAQAQAEAGQLAAAHAEALAALQAAQKLGHDPLLAEAHLLLGDVLEREGEYAQASDEVRLALLAAQRGRHEEVVARALALMVWVDGYQRQRAEAFELLAQLGAATLDRLGAPDLLRAELAQSFGSALQVNRRLDEALEQFRLAEELRAARLGPEHYLVAAARNNTAAVYYLQCRYAEALAIHRAVLRAIEAALGPEHPNAAVCLDNIGASLSALERMAEARAAHARAHAIRRRLFGDENVQTAASLANLADLDRRAGRYTEAVAAYKKVLEVFTRRLGPSHPYLAYPEVGLGRCALGRRQYALAGKWLEAGLSRMSVRGVFSPLDVAEARFALAQALAAGGGDRVRARQLATEALEGLGSSGADATLRRRIEAWLRE